MSSNVAAAPAPAIVDINLLPAIHRPAQVTGLQLAIASLLLVAFLAMIPLAFRLDTARTQAADARQLASDAEVELGGLESELAEHRALVAETEVTRAQLDLLVAKRDLFQGGQRSLADDLFWLYGFGFLPTGSRITNVATNGEGFQVDGVAAGPLDGIAFAAKLVEVGGFPSARMTSYTPADNAGGHFSLEVTR
jgi:hypothetical protein